MYEETMSHNIALHTSTEDLMVPQFPDFRSLITKRSGKVVSVTEKSEHSSSSDDIELC